MAISKIGSDALASGAPSRAQLPAGTVLQVVSANYSSVQSTTSGTFQASGLTLTITPTSATSKIMLLASVPYSVYNNANPQGALTIYRNSSTNLAPTGFALLYAPTESQSAQVLSYLDSPATTSATTYTVYFRVSTAGTARIFIDNYTGTLTAMEIAA